MVFPMCSLKLMSCFVKELHLRTVQELGDREVRRAAPPAAAPTDAAPTDAAHLSVVEHLLT